LVLGIGDGVILKAFIRLLISLELAKMICVCIWNWVYGRFSSYVDFNTVHTTHGRTVAFLPTKGG